MERKRCSVTTVVGYHAQSIGATASRSVTNKSLPEKLGDASKLQGSLHVHGSWECQGNREARTTFAGLVTDAYR